MDEAGVPAVRRGLDHGGQPRVLDLFAGTAAIAGEAAGRYACEADTVELNPVAHVIARCTWLHGAEHGKPDGAWRGLVAEYRDVAERVWRDAESRVSGQFDP